MEEDRLVGLGGRSMRRKNLIKMCSIFNVRTPELQRRGLESLDLDLPLNQMLIDVCGVLEF